MYTGGLGMMTLPCNQFGNEGQLPEDSATNLNLSYDPGSGCYYDASGQPVDDGGNPIALVPTVIQTIDYTGSSPVVVHTIQPVSIDPTMIPQQLPTLTAVAHAGMPGWTWVGLGLLALWGLSKGGGGRSGRSW